MASCVCACPRSADRLANIALPTGELWLGASAVPSVLLIRADVLKENWWAALSVPSILVSLRSLLGGALRSLDALSDACRPEPAQPTQRRRCGPVQGPQGVQGRDPQVARREQLCLISNPFAPSHLYIHCTLRPNAMHAATAWQICLRPSAMVRLRGPSSRHG